MLEGGSCPGHNSVIAQLPNKISNCAVISTSNIPGESDRLHFTHDGYKELGKRYAEKMLTMIDFDGKCPDGSQIEPKVLLHTRESQPNCQALLRQKTMMKVAATSLGMTFLQATTVTTIQTNIVQTTWILRKTEMRTS